MFERHFVLFCEPVFVEVRGPFAAISSPLPPRGSFQDQSQVLDYKLRLCFLQSVGHLDFLLQSAIDHLFIAQFGSEFAS